VDVAGGCDAGIVPTRSDLVGGTICLVGMAIIALQPKVAS
jgi:small multidrug resistance family-3 protein